MKKHPLQHSVIVAIAIVLVWRGIWYVLDAIDKWIFDGSHWWTSAIGVVIGLAILYAPDRDLKEIEKL